MLLCQVVADVWSFTDWIFCRRETSHLDPEFILSAFELTYSYTIVSLKCGAPTERQYTKYGCECAECNLTVLHVVLLRIHMHVL